MKSKIYTISFKLYFQNKKNNQTGFLRNDLRKYFYKTVNPEMIFHDSCDHSHRNERGKLLEDGSVQHECHAIGYNLVRLYGESLLKKQKTFKIPSDILVDIEDMVKSVNGFDYFCSQPFLEIKKEHESVFNFLIGHFNRYISKVFHYSHSMAKSDYIHAMKTTINEIYKGFLSCLSEYKLSENYALFSKNSIKEIKSFFKKIFKTKRSYVTAYPFNSSHPGKIKHYELKQEFNNLVGFKVKVDTTNRSFEIILPPNKFLIKKEDKTC